MLHFDGGLNKLGHENDKKMKPISAYFISPPINTELTEPDVSNQVSGANIHLMLFLSLKCLMNRMLMKDLMQTFYMLLMMNI